MYIAASFIMAKTWEPPNCPSTSRQDKLWHIHTKDYKTTMKKKTPKNQTSVIHKHMAKYHRHYGEQNKEEPNMYVLYNCAYTKFRKPAKLLYGDRR